MSARPVLSSAVRTDPGRKRELNQDAGGRFEPSDAGIRAERGCLYVIADGIGGHAAGEVAAEYAVEKVLHSYYALPWQGPEVTLVAALQAANADIHAEGQRERSRRGMGCTMVAAAVLGDQAVIAHAGDSRAYLIRGGTARPLTRDHSWVALRIAAGELTPEQATTHPNRNLILRNLGGKPGVQPDVSTHTLQPGDRLVLCSDGLWGTISDPEIAALAGAGDAAQAVDALIAAANLAGGPDNIGVAVIVVGDGPPAATYLPGAAAAASVSPGTTAAVQSAGSAGLARADAAATAGARPPASRAPASPVAKSTAGMRSITLPGFSWSRSRVLPAAGMVGLALLVLSGGLFLAGRRMGADDAVAGTVGGASTPSVPAGQAAGGAGSGRAVVSAATPRPEATACLRGETRPGFVPYCVKEGEPFSLVYDRCAIDTVQPEQFRRALVQPENVHLNFDPAALQEGLVWLPLPLTKAACGGTGDVAGVPPTATPAPAVRTAAPPATVAGADPRVSDVPPTIGPAVSQPAPVFGAPAVPAPVRTPVPQPEDESGPTPTELPSATAVRTQAPPTAERTAIPERTTAPLSTPLPTRTPTPTAVPIMPPTAVETPPPSATPTPTPVATSLPIAPSPTPARSPTPSSTPEPRPTLTPEPPGIRETLG